MVAYASWSVVFGEQPSAAKWNILGTNDAFFNTFITQNAYCFRAWDSGGTTLSDATIAQINLATEDYDYNSNFASSAYTVPVAGVYHFDGRMQINGAIATAVVTTCYIYKNGATVADGVQFIPTSNNSSPIISADLLLAASDVITFRGFQDSAGAEATTQQTNSTYFSGHLVHPL